MGRRRDYEYSFHGSINTDGESFSMNDEGYPYFLNVSASATGWSEDDVITDDPYTSYEGDGDFSVDKKSIEIEEFKEYIEETREYRDKEITEEEEKVYIDKLYDFLEENSEWFES